MVPPLEGSSKALVVSEERVNFVLNPKPSHFNPLSHTHPESLAEVGLEQLYKLESIGIKENSDLGSFDDLKIREFREAISFSNGKYFVELPWKEELVKCVPSNHAVALATLQRVVRNLSRNNLLSEYGAVFHQQLEEGIIEKITVPPSEYSKYIWVPHRPVIKQDPQVTTKIRPVFNCSLKTGHAPSLNDASFPGVDLMGSLFKLLCSFRSNKFAILADIKQAFLQIRLKLEEDKNRFCFFWEEQGKLVSYRYTSIVFGLASSPFVLNFVVKHHASKYPPDLCSKILQEYLYIDNLVYTASTSEEIREVYKTTTQRLAEGGFDLRSWNTNEPEVRAEMQADGKAVSHDCSEERVLGYLYNFLSDSIRLCDFSLDENVRSKRSLLSQISKVFDPLSLYLPVTIRGRLLMRKTWGMGLSWDEELGEDILKSWHALSSDLNALKDISFPRTSFCSSEENLSVHVFCDASSLCYGFSVYVSSSTSAPRLLLAKSKVAPLEKRTLPSLELLSVFLAFKCLPQVFSSFRNKFCSLNIFSDAQIVLAWLSSKKLKSNQVFVRNRVQDIHRMSDEISKNFSVTPSFLYVRSEENPADLVTRGISFKEFSKKLPLWNHGPEWLSFSKHYWPQQNTISSLTHVGVIADATTSPEPPCINVARFSSLTKLLRTTALCFRFLSKLRKTPLDLVSASERARLFWLKTMQEESFSGEIEFLQKVKAGLHTKDQVPDLVKRLNLFLDDQGLIRSKGRLARSNYFQYEVLNPVLLSKEHHFTSLIIKDAHFRCKHLGIQSTLTNLRLQGFWVTKARNTIRKVLSDCAICNRFNHFAFSYPKFTNFTKAQMRFVRPFQHVGVDFTSHYWVKDVYSDQPQKMYILIYTCLNIRAIHLDLLPDMSSKSFLQSFQRFSNTFGTCDFLYSDNARSFIQGGAAIEKSLASDEFQEFLRENRIQHRRIPLYAPWMGAAWERLIRVVKSCLVKALHQKHSRDYIDFFDFITLLTDVTRAVNARPLTYMSGDDDLIPLTPDSFLRLHSPSGLVFREEEDPEDPIWSSEETAQEALVASFEHLRKKFLAFKTRWYEEYLLSLREFSRDLYGVDWSNRIGVGDVVLIKSPVKSRPFWQMGRVTQLIPGDDQKVRSAFVRHSNGSVDKYPISRLYPLEISVTHAGNRKTKEVPAPEVPPPLEVTSDSSSLESPAGATGRPQRMSAKLARDLITKCLS